MVNSIGNVHDGNHVEFRLDKSQSLLGWLAGELACWDPATGRGSGDPVGVGSAGGESAGFGLRALSTTEGVSRLTRQMSRLCELVRLSVEQVDVHADLGMGWVLLEQARQQLGHAANAAAEVEGDDQRESESPEGVDGEIAAVKDLWWFLQRDLMPWSDDVSVMVEFGSGPDVLPDFRPDTPLEFGPLQMLAHATMTGIAGEAVSDVDDAMMRMAFGEYVGRILDEAMELLYVAAEKSGSRQLRTLTATGWEAQALLMGVFPWAEQIFRGPAGFPESPAD